MTSEDLNKLIHNVVASRAEFQNIELKSARKGCPEKLYDTLSAFSNRDDGGIILFGIDEKNGYALCGVYDLQDLQQKITEQCNSMTPAVRPLFSYTKIDGKNFCSIEVPAIDLADRPCYYSGKGRLKGSYIRVGTNDEMMTEYEIYSYEAYRKKYQDDIRPVERVTENAINTVALENYIDALTENKPNLAKIDRSRIAELMNLTSKEQYTLVTTLLFGIYPQAYFPQLCIIATVLPSNDVGTVGEAQERFIDNLRIEGTISEMLSQALLFVRKNIKTKTIIDKTTGKRTDRTDYPLTAVREVILNALVHRDYSIHTEGMPIQLQIFPDRLVVTNPGGLYGRISLDKLGQVQPDTRNPVLATALEVMKITENRYSGIPTIRREMAAHGLQPPIFEEARGSFRVTLLGENVPEAPKTDSDLLAFCTVPRSRKEVAEFLGIKSVAYAVSAYILPLIETGELRMTLPDHPKSPRQTYVRTQK